MGYEDDSRLLKVLSSLNRIGATINHVGTRDAAADVTATLRLIA